MNEAKFALRCRMRPDEKLTDPRICEWDLQLCFVAAHPAPREDRLTLRDIAFLWWGWCAVSQHVPRHNAICSTPALCDAARCSSTLQCRTVVRTDFQSILIILWPGIQFKLQYRWWVWTEIDPKVEILLLRDINYWLVTITYNKKTPHLKLLYRKYYTCINVKSENYR